MMSKTKTLLLTTAFGIYPTLVLSQTALPDVPFAAAEVKSPKAPLTAEEYNQRVLQHQSETKSYDRAIERTRQQADLEEERARLEAANIKRTSQKAELAREALEAREAQARVDTPVGVTREDVQAMIESTKKEIVTITQAAVQKQNLVQNTAKKPQLMGVMSDGRAVVKGAASGATRMIKPGEVVDDYLLIHTAADHAVFDANGERITVWLGQ